MKLRAGDESTDASLMGGDYGVESGMIRRSKFLFSILTALCLAVWTAGAVRAAAPVGFTIGEFTFERPGQWTWVETDSPMRQAHLRIEEGDAVADIAFFHFGPGQGGGVDANIGRWFSQFQEEIEAIHPRVEQVELNGTPVSFVRAEGSYNTALPGQPPVYEPGTGLFGAILESDQGDVFVRMTGPSDLVEAAAADFRAFIEQAASGS